MKSIHEYLIDKSQEDAFKILDAELTNIREFGGKPLNYYVSVDENGFTVPKDLNENFSSLVNSFVNNIEFLDEESFFSDYETIVDEDLFWKTFKALCQSYRKLRKGTLYLVNLDKDKFEECIMNLFYKYILFFTPLSAENGFTMDQTGNILNVLETCNSIIIAQRFSKSNFIDYAEKRFGFSDKNSEFIWNLYIKNKQDLQFRHLMDGIDETEKAITLLQSTFASLEDDNLSIEPETD